MILSALGFRQIRLFIYDEKSKMHIIDMIKLHLGGTPIASDSSYAHESYWTHPKLIFSKGEVFVDGGAYTGDTVILFINTLNNGSGSYKATYVFEPELENYETAVANLKMYPFVDIVKLGLHSIQTQLEFYIPKTEHIAASMLAVGAGEHIVTVGVTSLDVFLRASRIKSFPP